MSIRTTRWQTRCFGAAALCSACSALLATLPGCQTNVPSAAARPLLAIDSAAPLRPAAASATLQAEIAAPTPPGRSGSHAPTITAFPDGEFLAAWYSYVGPGELDGAAIYTARRTAGAAAWAPPEVLIDAPLPHGNPVLHSEGDRVWLFFAVVPGTGWSTAHIEFQTSADRGHTWTAPQPITGPPGANVKYPPVRTAAGDLLLPAYDDLLSRTLFFNSSTPQADAWRLASTLASAPPHNCIQPSVAPLSDGRLLAVMRNTGSGWLWYSTSADDGRTWATPARGDFPNPASATALLRLASGNLLLVYNDSNTDRHPLSAALSGDDGATWRPPRILVDGPGAYSYPSAIQTSDGMIHIVYSHDRQWIGHIEVSEAWLGASTTPTSGS